MTRVATGAASALGGIRSRMEEELRDQAERFLQRMNLVTREEHVVVAALAAKARAEQEALSERVAALEAKLSAKTKRPASVAASTRPSRRGTASPKSKTGRPRRPRGES